MLMLSLLGCGEETQTMCEQVQPDLDVGQHWFCFYPNSWSAIMATGQGDQTLESIQPLGKRQYRVQFTGMASTEDWLLDPGKLQAEWLDSPTVCDNEWTVYTFGSGVTVTMEAVEPLDHDPQ